MSQITKGIRAILSSPIIYSLFLKLIGAHRFYQILTRDFIRPNSGIKVLDIGCGPGTILPYLPPVNYIGFDASQEYIDQAHKKYSHRGKFICDLVTTANLTDPGSYDLVLALGVLHHLEDQEVEQLFLMAQTALKPGGRLVTFDPVYVDHQSIIAKWIISKDRGQNVRTNSEYVKLANQIFKQVTFNIRHNLLRIPYTHLFLECEKIE